MLSHSFPEQADDFGARELDAFDQTDQHPHVWQHRRTRHTRPIQHHAFQSQFHRRRRFLRPGLLGRARLGLIPRRHLPTKVPLPAVERTGMAAAAAIEEFLLPFARSRLVVRSTPLAGTLPPIVLPAAEGTTQVPPTCVPGMREKADPAVNAVRDAPLKLGMGLQDRVQRGLILPDQRPGAVVLMPIRAKREKLLDGDGKKARLSVIMEIVLCTPSSYLIDADASRGRARFFCARWTEICNRRRRKRPATYRSPNPFRLPSPRRLPARHILT